MNVSILLRKLLPKMQRRNSGFGFENFGEMGGMFKTEFVRNFTYRFCGSQEDVFCLVDQLQMDVFYRRFACEFTEQI